MENKGFYLGNYLRIRVSIDISMLLCRGRLVRMGGPSPSWVDFRYERLPIFCYWCGMIDHDEKDCMQWMRSKESLKAEDKQYGPWLWAMSERVQQPQLVVVSKNEGRKEHKTAADGVSTMVEQLVNMGRELTTATIQSAHEDDDVATCRAEVASFDEPKRQEIMRIPCNPQCPGFEEQLKEIDDATFGEVLTKETSTKRMAGEKEALKEISQLEVTNASHNVGKANGSGLLLNHNCNEGQHEESLDQTN